MTAQGDWSRHLLAALLREDDPAARALARSGGDWAALASLVDFHQIGPYLGSLLRDNPLRPFLPEDLLARLEERRRKTVVDNVLLFASARPVLRALVDAGITPIILKGPALLPRVYPDPGARPMTDIDLLLPAGSIRQAGLLLEQAGLRHLEDEQRAARRTAFQTPGRATVPVEVHWDLSQRHRFRPDLEGIWRRSLPFELEGFAVRRLAPADEFVYLALHYAAHYFGLTLKWLVDLRELLRRNPPDLEEIAARAGEWRGRAGVHFALRYLGKVYPDLDDAGGSRRRLSQPLRDILIRPWLSEDPLLLVSSKERGPFRLLLGLLLVDRPADMLRLGWATLLSPDPEHDPPRAPDPRRVRTGSP